MSRRPDQRPSSRPGGRGSWWLPLLLAFFGAGLLTWVTFLYMRIRARRRDWLLAATGYAVAAALVLANEVVVDPYGDQQPNTNLAYTVLTIGGFIHAVVATLAWRRFAVGDDTVRVVGRRRTRPARGGGSPPAWEADVLGLGNPAVAYFDSGPVEHPDPIEHPGPIEDPGPSRRRPVEVNTATQSQLEALPGIGVSLARQIVRTRGEQGGFTDLDHLTRIVNLAPHVMLALRDRVSFAEPAAGTRRPPDPEPPRGRVLDV